MNMIIPDKMETSSSNDEGKRLATPMGNYDTDYELLELARSKDNFKQASITANKWYWLWNVIAYSQSAILGITGFLLALQGNLNFLSDGAITTIGAATLVVTIAEAKFNFKGRAHTAEIIRDNYTVVAGKLDLALISMTKIKEDGIISNNKMSEWHMLCALVDYLIEQARKYPSGVVVTADDTVKSAQSNIQAMQKKLLEQQQHQRLGIDTLVYGEKAGLSTASIHAESAAILPAKR